MLIKIDARGNFEWSRIYGSKDMDGGSSIVQDTDGSYLMAGLLWNRSTFGTESHGRDPGLVKADSAGNLLWLKNYPSLGQHSTVVRGSDGSYIFCSGMLDKIDTDGNLLWSKNVSFIGNLGNGHAETTSLAVQTNDGRYAVAGTVISTPNTSQNMTSYVWIGKLDSEGNPVTFNPESYPSPTSTSISPSPTTNSQDNSSGVPSEVTYIIATTVAFVIILGIVLTIKKKNAA